MLIWKWLWQSKENVHPSIYRKDMPRSGESLYSLHANVAAACDVHTVTDTVF